LFLQDDIPWVIGYSGGKDSSATLQLVWMALKSIEPSKLPHKAVHVITNDTLVENPLVSAWVMRSHKEISRAAIDQGLNVQPHRILPKVRETFWVSLIGKGYPAPNRRFRWCTDRMKIWPSTAFIRSVIATHGESIIVLGTRRAESASRAARIDKYAEGGLRDGLTPHSDLPSSLVLSPIANWSDDDVWMFLMQYPNPWNFDNKELLSLYAGASEDGECPVVIDTSTPSCGNSRFGCWTCTVVEKDKSMAAMIRNDHEKEWMNPLLQFRDRIAAMSEDVSLRDFRRMNGRVQLYRGDRVYGPFTRNTREQLLRQLLRTQALVQEHGPSDVDGLELISIEELHEIRRIWVVDKNEVEDIVPSIFEDELQQPFPGEDIDNAFPFGKTELELLSNIAANDLNYELLRDILVVEHRKRTQSRRHGLSSELRGVFDRSGFSGEDEAVAKAFASSEVASRSLQDFLPVVDTSI
jgi:DNA sulfur modification protein DndC